MPIARTFLDWQQPALHGAVEYLIERYGSQRQLDLERVVVITPGARAGRKLLELLVEYAEKHDWVLVPPQIHTVGGIPELLYVPKRPFASPVVQQLAWVAALRSIAPTQLARVIPQVPEDGDLPRWMQLGKLLAGLHRELAAEALDFQDVLNHGIHDADSEERKRWQALRRVQKEYLATLDELAIWDLQTARLVAISQRECTIDRDVVLVATADLNVAVRRMLEQVADRVTALVFAPESLAHCFDEHGCLRPEVWSEAKIVLRDEQILVAEGPAQQVDETERQVAQWVQEHGYGPHEVVVGAPDERLVPQLVRRLQECGAPARWGVGRLLAQQPAVRLLEAIIGLLDNPRFDAFAELLRHPDVYDWLSEQVPGGGWLAECDAYYSEHLPPTLGEWLGNPAQHARLKRVHATIEHWLQPLHGPPQPLPQWAGLLGKVIAQVYDHRELNPDDPEGHALLESVRGIHAALESLLDIPNGLAPAVTAAQALRITLDQLNGHYVAPLPQEEALEILGWLELPLDVAPAMVVTSFNESFIPASVNSDMFLPNALRRRLKLLDNQRRYARDAYAVQCLAASRRQVAFVVGRRDERGDPLIPSRLVFADEPQVIARRVLSIFHPQRADEAGEIAAPQPRVKESTRFLVPAPLSMPSVTTLPVTALRAYLQCPYRFYLRYVLGLRAVDDEREELDGAAFGSLLHHVLRDFGRGPLRHATEEETIRGALFEALDQTVQQQFGQERLAPVNVQLRQLRARLESFAHWQAEWANSGWRIHDVEVPVETSLDEAAQDGRVLRIAGRLDRIDRHRDTGRYVIFDYKSSDSGKCPEETHYRGGEWVDLQLPLYRRLARSLGIAESDLGYILLPKDTRRVGAAIASWSEQELDDAEQAALDVARSILAARYWPPATDVVFDDFAWICQQSVFHRQLAEITG